MTDERTLLKKSFAVCIAQQVVESYGLQGSEKKVAKVIYNWMESEASLVIDGTISHAIDDVGDSIGVMTAPWDDEDWFKPVEGTTSVKG